MKMWPDLTSKEAGTDVLGSEIYRQLQGMLRQVYGQGVEPLSSPVWIVFRCPVCGKTGMAFFDGPIVHVSRDHIEEYRRVARELTWAQARTYFGPITKEVFGLGPLHESPGSSGEKEWRMRRERFIAMADYLTGVTGRKPPKGRKQ